MRKGAKEKRGNPREGTQPPGRCFHVFIFFASLRDVPPKAVRIRDYPLGFPLVYGRTPKYGHLDYVKVVWYSYNITMLGSTLFQFQKHKTKDEQI